jgi:phospholipase C
MSQRIVGVVLCSALLAACSGNAITPPTATNEVAPALANLQSPSVAAGSKTQHVIVIIQENRTFDNMFNGFPGANTVSSGKNHLGKTVKLRPQGLEWQYDPSHAHASLATEYNKGAMNGFDLDTCDSDPLSLTGGCTPPANFTYSYVPPSEAQFLWILGGQYAIVHLGYGIADNMFSSRQVPSFPGHQFLIAGQTPAADDPYGPGESDLSGIWGCDAPKTVRVSQFGKTYNGPLVPGVPCYNYKTIGDLLTAKGVSWKYYTGAVGTVDGSISAYDAIKHIRYSTGWKKHVITPMTDIFSDIENGTLPAVSFVTPPFAASDHGGSLSAGGPAWVASIYAFVTENKALYANTTILVTWDDSGGWYDHVKPPSDSFGPLGFRVPLLFISPYAVQKISHVQHSYGSILRFIENNWNLGSLGAQDAQSDGLQDMYNYKQKPIKPIVNFGSFNRSRIEQEYSPAYWRVKAEDTRPIDDDR